MNRLDSERAAAALLTLFYAIGLAAHLFAPTRALMISLTPFVLLAGGGAVVALALRTATAGRGRLIVWCLAVIAGTFGVEVLGVHTALVFGGYRYGTVLGLKAAGVPLVIGFNWALVVLGASLAAGRILDPLQRAAARDSSATFGRQDVTRRASRRATVRTAGSTLLFVLLTGLLAALFDLAMEPAAVALGYWSWTHGAVPFQNYAAWFILAAAAALLFRTLHVRLTSSLPITYLAVQWGFFLALDLSLVRHLS